MKLKTYVIMLASLGISMFYTSSFARQADNSGSVHIYICNNGHFSVNAYAVYNIGTLIGPSEGGNVYTTKLYNIPVGKCVPDNTLPYDDRYVWWAVYKLDSQGNRIAVAPAGNGWKRCSPSGSDKSVYLNVYDDHLTIQFGKDANGDDPGTGSDGCYHGNMSFGDY